MLTSPLASVPGAVELLEGAGGPRRQAHEGLWPDRRPAQLRGRRARPARPAPPSPLRACSPCPGTCTGSAWPAASGAGCRFSSKLVRAPAVCLLCASLQRHGFGLISVPSKCAGEARAPVASACMATRTSSVPECRSSARGPQMCHAGHRRPAGAHRCGCCWPARASSRPSARCTLVGSAAWSSASWRRRVWPQRLPAGTIPREAAVHAWSGLGMVRHLRFQPLSSRHVSMC